MLVSSTSRITFLIVLFLSLLITGVNIVLYPLAEPGELETKRYGTVGISFELEPGYDFNTSKLGEESLTYFEGFFFRLQNDNITLDHNLTITWRKAEPLNITGAIIRAYNFTGEETVVYKFGSLFNATIYEHNLTYTIFTKKGYENRTGFIGYWNCTNSGRIHTLLLDAPSDTANTTLLKQVFNYTVSTFVCHYPGQRPWNEESVKLPFDVQDLIEISLMVILCIGFTFTYMMEGFPNFAHTSYASMGAIASFYLVRFHGFNPYDTWPFASMFGGFIGILLYIFIVKPIRRHGGYQEITLTITFLVISIMMSGFAAIFSYWVIRTTRRPSRGFNLRGVDFNWNGIPGIALIGTASCIILVIGVHYFLTKTKTGISLRATAENENLAATIGVNTFRAHCISWFISGGLAALAGSIISISRGMGFQGPDGMIVGVMTGAILGGLTNIYGAIIGGIFIAVARQTFTDIMFLIIGLEADWWSGLLPLIFLLVATAFFPNGFTSRDSETLHKLRRIWRQFWKKD
jgi:branched-subunit amino acid ABC-type transport system permease component